MKKLSVSTVIVIILIFSSLVYAEQHVESQVSPNQNGLKSSLLWEISGNELTEPSFLYGTMHLTCQDKGVDKAKVQSAIDKSHQLYLEIDLDDPNVMLEMVESLSDHTKVKDIKDAEKRDKLLKLASKHLEMNSALIGDVDLFSLFSLLAYKSVTACSLPSSVEEALIQKFNQHKKNIEALETFAQQEQFMQDSGMMSVDAIIDSLENFDKGKIFFNQMTQVYFNENIDELYSMMTTPSEIYSMEYIEKFTAVLLEQRNKNWVEVMPDIAKEHPTFFAVGAGHLPGEYGVIQLLRKKGYKVEAILD